MTDKFKSTRELYNKLGNKYLKLVSKAHVRELFDFVKLFSPKSKILDVGCAGGRDSKVFYKNGFNVTGIDTSSSFLKAARKLVPKAKFYKKDLRDLKFKEESFDGVWASAVLLHIDRKDILKVLKNFYRILKIHGYLHISVKKGKGTKLVRGGLTPNNDRLFTYFTSTELKRLLEKAGFKVVLLKNSSSQLNNQKDKWITIWGQKLK